MMECIVWKLSYYLITGETTKCLTLSKCIYHKGCSGLKDWPNCCGIISFFGPKCANRCFGAPLFHHRPGNLTRVYLFNRANFFWHINTLIHLNGKKSKSINYSFGSYNPTKYTIFLNLVLTSTCLICTEQPLFETYCN